MMRKVAATLVFALYALCLPIIAGATDTVQYDSPTPHYDPGTGYTCVTCHTTNLTLGSTGYNNVCLSCHRVGDARAGNLPFTLADAANPFNNHSTTGINKMKQTSHAWTGNDVEPRAGAQKPITLLMNSVDLENRTGNSLACVRCHDPHRNDKSCGVCHDPNYSNAQLGPNGQLPSANFLRMSNDGDQLCMDCHRSWNVASHQLGSHPVSINYSSAVAANPALFNKYPKNTNQANASSDLNARLTASGQQVLCTTCHAVHYADSRSSTVDGQAAFATISSGDGFVLRTDRRSKMVVAGQPDNTNAGGQDIQCDDCHGAHVSYDPADPTGSQGVNQFLIRRLGTAPSQTSKIFFRYTSSSKREYVNTDGTGSGVCQGCHAAPTDGIHTTVTSADCNKCHAHNNSAGSFSPACNTCHGYPPATMGNGAPHTTATDCSRCHGDISSHNVAPHQVTISAACIACHPVLGGSHAIHVGNLMSLVTAYSTSDAYFGANNSDSSGYRFGCVYCHPTTNPNHRNDQIVLNTTNGAVVTTKVSVTCAASTCHSDGNGTYKTSPNWYTGFTGADRCAMCHASSPTSGSHAAHLSINGIHAGSDSIDYGATPNFGCVKCHAATVNASKAIVGFQNHVNGKADVAFEDVLMVSKAQIAPVNFGAYSTVWTRTNGYQGPNSSDVAKFSLAVSGAYASGTKTCSTIACHNNGTPVWGSGQLSCAACHSQL